MLCKGSKFVKEVSVQLKTNKEELVVVETHDINDGNYTASLVSKLASWEGKCLEKPFVVITINLPSQPFLDHHL